MSRVLLLSIVAGMCASAMPLGRGVRAAETKAILIDREAKTITLTGRIAKQDVYEQLKGAVEYLACCADGKEYESLIILDADPGAICEAFTSLGLKPGKPAREDDQGKHWLPEGAPVTILVEWEADGKTHRVRAEDLILNAKTGKTMSHVAWTYTGSQPGIDPNTEKEVLQVVLVKNIIAIHHLDPSVLLQNPLAEAADDNLYRANRKRLPKEGTKVKLTLDCSGPKAAAGHQRIHVFVSGRVQGVGFRYFTRLNALRLKLRGWVRNLEDGRVELVAEGPRDTLDQLLAKIRKGPRAAKVKDVEVKEERPTGEFTGFEIRH